MFRNAQTGMSRIHNSVLVKLALYQIHNCVYFLILMNLFWRWIPTNLHLLQLINLHQLRFWISIRYSLLIFKSAVVMLFSLPLAGSGVWLDSAVCYHQWREELYHLYACPAFHIQLTPQMQLVAEQQRNFFTLLHRESLLLQQLFLYNFNLFTSNEFVQFGNTSRTKSF